MFFLILAGWVNRQQQQVIEYLRTENQILREIQGPNRLLLTDARCRRFTVKGKVPGRKLLDEVGTRDRLSAKSLAITLPLTSYAKLYRRLSYGLKQASSSSV